MTVYKPGEVNIQELLQKQHEKYGKKMLRGYEYVTARNKALEAGESVHAANEIASRAARRLDVPENL